MFEKLQIKATDCMPGLNRAILACRMWITFAEAVCFVTAGARWAMQAFDPAGRWGHPKYVGHPAPLR